MSLTFLFLLFIKISLFTFGGGYAMIPLFQDELVLNYAFISPEEFANMVALAQITPGPVGLNAATYIGAKQLGIAGAAAGTLGVMMPSLVLTTLAAVFLTAFKDSRIVKGILSGIRPATVGLIAAAVLFFADTSLFTAPTSVLWKGAAEKFGISWQGIAIFAAVLVLDWRWKINPAWLVPGAALAGYVLFLF